MAPEVKLVGFEPLGSPSMYNSLQMNQPVVLDTLETFVDGASMKRTGRIPFVIIPL
jgi:threonine dehydratase